MEAPATGGRKGMNDRPTAASGDAPQQTPSEAAASTTDDGDDSAAKAASRRRIFESDPPRKLTSVLTELVNDPSRSRISVGDLVQNLKFRAFGAMLLIFALPNALPALPGTSAILGLPLLYLTFQLMLGRAAWLPGFISNRSMQREDMAKLIAKMSPWLHRAERLLVPRLLWVTSPVAERVIGALCLVLAIVLVLPIPLGNMLPALAISLMALGLLEKDGLWILLGALVGIGSLVIVYGVLFAFAKALIFVIVHAFS